MSDPRAIRPDEVELVADLYNNAYRVGPATARGWVANLDPANTLAAVETGRIASLLQILPYRIWVGGREMPMGGIGGVATWADCQGKGYAGALMRESVRLLRERGCPVSALYPFSHRYYRKFGWETVGERLTFGPFTPSDVHRFPERERVRACLGEADLDRLSAVYEAWGVRYNGMVRRDRAKWEGRLRGLAASGGQTYWIEGDDGSALGYFICENHPADHGKYESRTPEVACLSPVAWRAFFGFLSTLPTNVAALTFSAPPDPPLWDYFTEPFFPVRVGPLFQIRVVDVATAVAARGIPEGVAGRVAVAVEDEQGDWNRATWRLEFADGRATAKQTTADTPDIHLTIQQFSRLFLGGADAVALAARGQFPAASPGALALLRDAFHDRTPYLADAF